MDSKGNNSGGNNPQIQGGNSGTLTFGPGSNIYQGNTQTGGGWNNPQVQGDISAGTGGNINLGLQGANINSGSQVSGGGYINTGNQGYGGGNANTGTR